MRDFIEYRFEKTSASKAQKRRADAVIKSFGSKKNLSPEQSDMLSRAKMVQDRQNVGARIRHNVNLLRQYEAGKSDRYGIGRGTAEAELKRLRKEGKLIGDAKRAGKLTVPVMVDTQIGKLRAGLKAVEPNVKGSGLTSKLQPTTRFASGKQRATDAIKKVFRR